MIDLTIYDSCANRCNQIMKIPTTNSMKVIVMVSSITWLWVGCHEQLTVGMTELLHNLVVCGGTLLVLFRCEMSFMSMINWEALYMKNSECQRCTSRTSHFIPWKCWHHGNKFWIKIMCPECFNFICQVRHRHWALGLRLILCLLFQLVKKPLEWVHSLVIDWTTQVTFLC